MEGEGIMETKFRYEDDNEKDKQEKQEKQKRIDASNKKCQRQSDNDIKWYEHLLRTTYQNKKEAERKLADVLAKIDVVRVSELSKSLYSKGVELKNLYDAVNTNPKLLREHKEVIRAGLDCGLRDLERLNTIFIETGVYELLDKIDTQKELVACIGGIEDLSLNEKECIKKLGFTDNEWKTLSSLFEAYKKGEHLSLQSVLGAYIKELDNFLDQESQHEDTPANESDKCALYYTLIGYKVFFGTSLIGLDFCGYLASGGVAIGYIPALGSAIVGTNIIIDGAIRVIKDKI
jgi:hypothetical protein